MNDVSSMVKTKAKNVHETRTMVTELVNRMKIAEEITGDTVHDTHSKSILLGFIDDLSRQSSIDLHGHETSFLDLKNGIIKFANNATNSTSSSSSTPMVIGAVTAADGDAQAQELYPYVHSAHEAPVPGDGDDINIGVNALTSDANITCYVCQQKGHRAANCTNKGKGKGKFGAVPAKGIGKRDNNRRGGKATRLTTP